MSGKEQYQKYIKEKLNTLMEELVVELLRHQPDDAISYMIEFLEKKRNGPVSLTEENTALKNSLTQMEKKLKELESRSGISTHDDEDDDEEEEEDEVFDLPDFEVKRTVLKQRHSVSAEAYGEWNVKTAFTPPKYEKTDEQKARLTAILNESFLFQNLDTKELGLVIDAMQEKVLNKSTRIIEQGDDGDVVFVVEKGNLDCYKRFAGEEEEKLVKTCNEGDCFGELALLYNVPRAASVQSREGAILWQLDRETFNNIVKDAAQKKREMYEEFLERVPLLENMDPYERSKISDALKTETFKENDYIVRQNEEADKFYFIEEGSAVATKFSQTESKEKEVMKYTAGDYFGELALLTNNKRAANVKATSHIIKVATLDRKSFKRLLGPLQEILNRNTAKYGQ